MNNKMLLRILPLSVCMLSLPALGQEINWSIETGLGYESNVFHAPDHAYVDTALPSTRPAGIAITPVEKDGMFVPIDVQVDLINKMSDTSNFITGIGLDTKFMLDSDLSDASQTNVDLDLGFEYLLTKTMKSKKIKKAGNAYFGAFIDA